MADYYAILMKTISALPSNTAATRNAVYGKARAAIERQLRAIDPPPPEAAIERHLSQLSAAIARIEEEQAAVTGGELPPAVVAPPPVAPVAPKPASAPPRPAAGPSASPGPAPARAAAPAARPARPVLAGDAPPRPPEGGPAYDASLDALDDVDRPIPVSAAPTRPRASQAAEKRGGSGLIVLLAAVVLVVALVGAGAYAVWLNRDALVAAFGTDAPVEQPAPEAQPAESADVAPAQDAQSDPKEAARLGSDGQTVVAPLVEEEEAPAAQAPVTVTPVTPPAAGDTAVVAQDAQALPVEEAADPEAEPAPLPGAQAEAPAEVEQAPPETATAPGETAAPTAPVIGQKAFLYEEGIGGANATRDNAAIIWSIEQASPDGTLPPESVIKGRLEVPGRGLVMDLTIKRNTDEALPASHIIELLFSAPPEFSGGNVDTIARFVMKASEQARGEGLVAVPAKIDTGYFLIALNNLETARQTNERLLLESGWIDIPLGYTTGRRALVTLEKGAIGERVFREAIADWRAR